MDAGTAVNGEDLNTGHAGREFMQIRGNLHAEFPGWAEDQGLNAFGLRVQMLQQRQTKCRRFAGSGLSEPEQVVIA